MKKPNPFKPFPLSHCHNYVTVVEPGTRHIDRWWRSHLIDVPVIRFYKQCSLCAERVLLHTMDAKPE